MRGAQITKNCKNYLSLTNFSSVLLLTLVYPGKRVLEAKSSAGEEAPSDTAIVFSAGAQRYTPGSFGIHEAPRRACGRLFTILPFLAGRSTPPLQNFGIILFFMRQVYNHSSINRINFTFFSVIVSARVTDSAGKIGITIA
jgi:hypothetical protein